ncbi:MAG: hypothetical protein IT298_17370 [Chloroflexi bacterium]|nr:hypothetical protein [Chloroflexota bacterium]RIK20113.1 MAG: hypothetical protein DCC53_11510 [Chloroflexota bacterium]
MSESAGTIFAERSQREAGGKCWWWLSGDTYPHRDLLKRHGARFSSRRRAWYWIGETLPAAIRALVGEPDAPSPEPVLPPALERQILAVLAEDDALRTAAHSIEPSPDIMAEESPERPLIRVSKPASPPSDDTLDAVQHAIRAVKREPPMTPSAPSVSTGRLARIDQAFCGEITGSITGQVFCYGCAIYDGIAVYINLAGPRMAVEAIRAKLSKGEHVTVVPPDAPSVELTAGEGNTGMYHAYLHYLPEARFASLILVHAWAVAPNYGGKATTFIFRTTDAQAAAKLAHHVTQLVNVPVFEAWSAYLYDAGQRAMLVRKTRATGGIDLLTVDLDVDAWTRLITGGLEQGIIKLPQQTI